MSGRSPWTSLIGAGLLGLLFVAASGPAWSAAEGTAGCGAAPPQSGTYTLTHDGVQRTYRLMLPPDYNPHRPARVVFVFHGWGGDENEFLADPAVVAEAGRRGYVLVAPRGLGSGPPDNSNNSWTFRGSATGVVGAGGADRPVCDATITPDYRYPSCRQGEARNSCSWTQCQDDDVGFVESLIARLDATLCIDPRHRFAAGGSNGGMFTWELGMNGRTAPLLRAIAPIIGLPHRGDLRPPGRRGGMPVLLVTGTLDPVVPPGAWDDGRPTTTRNDNDRFYYTGATAIVRRWSRANGCPAIAKEKPFDVGRNDGDHPLECRTGCAPAGSAWPAVLDCREPMGHDYDLPRTWSLVLDFFDRL